MPPIELSTVTSPKSCEKVVRMVGQLWDAVAGEGALSLEVIEPRQVPEPYCGLLVHTSDMTSTLARHYGEAIGLRVVQRTVDADWLARVSILELSGGRPVEFGVIRIHLAILREPVRRLVLEGEVPLGALLNRHAVGYRSCPGGFFRIESNGPMNRAFDLCEATWLYGRCNCLSDAGGRTIAEVVEILPP